MISNRYFKQFTRYCCLIGLQHSHKLAMLTLSLSASTKKEIKWCAVLLWGYFIFFLAKFVPGHSFVVDWHSNYVAWLINFRLQKIIFYLLTSYRKRKVSCCFNTGRHNTVIRYLNPLSYYVRI